MWRCLLYSTVIQKQPVLITRITVFFVFQKMGSVSEKWLSDTVVMEKWRKFKSSKTKLGKEYRANRNFVERVEQISLYTVEVLNSDVGLQRDAAVTVRAVFACNPVTWLMQPRKQAKWLNLAEKFPK